MLEWMHDETVVYKMNKNFFEMTIDDCNSFIDENRVTEYEACNLINITYAIVDDNDEYMGSVSLKNIDKNTSNAEFAIVLRKCAMKKGYSKFAMNEIFKIGFFNYGLKNIYWYVRKENLRAIKFYAKMGYEHTDIDLQSVIQNEINNNDYYWYVAKENDKK